MSDTESKPSPILLVDNINVHERDSAETNVNTMNETSKSKNESDYLEANQHNHLYWRRGNKKVTISS